MKAPADAEKLLASGGADAYANAKTNLIPASKRMPDGRVLDGYWQIRRIAFGVPKGNLGASYMRRFVDELKASGYVKAAVERHPIPGYMAAP